MDSISRLNAAIKKALAYKLTHELVHDTKDNVACSCRHFCYDQVMINEMPTEKYMHCFAECMKGHGIITFDNTSLPTDCQEVTL